MSIPYHKLDDATLCRLYINKASNANNDGHEFTLTFSEYKRVVKRKTCALSGITFSNYKAGDKSFTALTLDRLDNSKGYISGNVIAVCNGINTLKSQWENPVALMNEKIVAKVLKNLKRLRKAGFVLVRKAYQVVEPAGRRLVYLYRFKK